MNNRFLRKTDTAIELTSLLDVIFIVLMVVICSKNYDVQLKSETAEKTVIEAEAAMHEAEEMMKSAEDALAENVLLREQAELCSDVFSQVTMVAIYANYEKNTPQHRIIRVAVNDNEPVKMTMLTPEEPHKGFDELEAYLTGILDKADGMPVIISVNRTGILYRDDAELTRVLNKFSGYKNLYEKRNASNE